MEIVHLSSRRAVLAGRFSLSEVADARQVLITCIDTGTDDFIVECGHLTITDITALGLLLELHRRADRGGRRLVLADVPPAMDRLLSRTRLGRVLHRCQTEKQLA